MRDNPAAAIADVQKYLDFGGGEEDDDTKEGEQMIADLKQER